MDIIIFALILSFLVIIHELGHYFAAKWSKVKVEEFGLGYPPRAKKLFTWRGTDFTLNWIPFGGFVRMAGEDMASAEEHAKAHGNVKGQFAGAPLWKRQIIILAGATVNFLFGVVAFAAIFSTTGIPIQLETARIGQIAPNSPAAEAGVPENVEIIGFKLQEEQSEEAAQVEKTEQLQVNVSTPAEVVEFVENHRGEQVSLLTTGTCEQLNCQEIIQEHSVYLRTQEETPQGEGSLGIVFAPVVFQFYPWYEMPFRSAWYGLDQALYLGQEILKALQQLVVDLVQQGSVPSELAGPVGIVHQAQESGIFQQGWQLIVSFAAMLSINLAIMNVLPIPPLDGGRAVLIFLELFVQKEKLMKIETYVNYGGYVLLLMLIILVTIRDVVRVFT